jgi:hypothetical protein
LYVELPAEYYSAVQTPGFSPPAPAENFQLRQIRKNSKFNGNFTFQSGNTIFVFDFNTSHEHFVLCLWQAYAVSMRVFTFSSMDSGFFADVRHYFTAQISAARGEQKPAPAK